MFYTNDENKVTEQIKSYIDRANIKINVYNLTGVWFQEGKKYKVENKHLVELSDSEFNKIKKNVANNKNLIKNKNIKAYFNI